MTDGVDGFVDDSEGDTAHEGIINEGFYNEVQKGFFQICVGGAGAQAAEDSGAEMAGRDAGVGDDGCARPTTRERWCLCGERIFCVVSGEDK